MYKHSCPHADHAAYQADQDRDEYESMREYDAALKSWQEDCSDLKEFGFYIDSNRQTILLYNVFDSEPEFFDEALKDFFPCAESIEKQAEEYRKLRDKLLAKACQLIQPEILEGEVYDDSAKA